MAVIQKGHAGGRGLTGYELKWIAIVSMTIDHIGRVLFPGVSAFRAVGRAAFPIFCFMIVEGFAHTHDLKKYMQRLVAFAFVSEIPFDLALHRTLWYPKSQNVFFTLAIGLAVLWIWSMEPSGSSRAGFLFVAAWGAEVLHTDYGAAGVILIALFQIARAYGEKWYVLCAAWNFFSPFAVQPAGVLAFPFLLQYNGERGRKAKYLFYVFFPAHLLVLYVIASYC